MPSASSLHDKLHFFGTSSDAFDEAVVGWGWPKFRGQQVRQWVFGKLVPDPEKMTNLGKLDRQRLAQLVTFFTATTTAHQSSSDGTQKLLLSWPDKNGDADASAETVMIPDADRRTACVSSQVGCPVGCKFCASGINGVKGNLSAGQIVEQVFALNRVLRAENQEAGRHAGTKARSEDQEARRHVGTKARSEETYGADSSSCLRASMPPCLPRINHVVFMGMGEPLANYANVMQAVRILHDPRCFNIGARKITISTVGVPPKMRQLADEQLPINLAISLHAPNEALRRQLIPWADHFALDDILDAARYYFKRTGREITLEYILLFGVNDRPEHARQLAKVVKSLRANVNLIRYNEVESLPYKRPKSDDVVKFQEILRRAGVNAHVRKSRGRDIDAACGQLRRREEQRQERLVQLKV